jgi:hypothetical protein
VSRENRRFARVRPAGLVSKSGKIIVDAKSPTVDCYVVDLSSGGACLEVPNPASIPKRFVLVHGATKKSCLVVWKAGRRLGVQF